MLAVLDAPTTLRHQVVGSGVFGFDGGRNGYRCGVVADLHERDAADASVADRWVAGHDDALRLAYEQFGALVLTYCTRSLRDRSAAMDCVQETFVSAWRSRDRFDPERGAFGAWLLGIARFRVLDAYGHAARTPVPIEDVQLRAMGTQEDPDDDRLADRLLIARALDSLSPRVRQVVELAFYSDLTQNEIASRLDMPLGTVKSDMRRGLEVMRRDLAGRSVAPAHTLSAPPTQKGSHDA